MAVEHASRAGPAFVGPCESIGVALAQRCRRRRMSVASSWTFVGGSSVPGGKRDRAEAVRAEDALPCRCRRSGRRRCRPVEARDVPLRLEHADDLWRSVTRAPSCTYLTVNSGHGGLRAEQRLRRVSARTGPRQPPSRRLVGDLPSRRPRRGRCCRPAVLPVIRVLRVLAAGPQPGVGHPARGTMVASAHGLWLLQATRSPSVIGWCPAADWGRSSTAWRDEHARSCRVP